MPRRSSPDTDALAADEAYEASVYETELARLRDLIDAQGGYIRPGDIAAQARGRAIDAVLAAIEGICVHLAEPHERPAIVADLSARVREDA